MTAENRQGFPTPAENFRGGLLQVEIPELREPIRGKVRDCWVVDSTRVIVTTDRQSAFDRQICTVPGKGAVLNEMSAYWFSVTDDIVPNHLIDVPHPNVTIAQEAAATIPAEVVVRRFIAASTTETSIYRQYFDKGRRNIYGIDFPKGLKPNQELPMGPIVTPTTKSAGHDEELTDEQARYLVDSKFKNGTWDAVKKAALAVYNRSFKISLKSGLIMADTKYEFGIDERDELMIIDEMNTPDSSRFWLESSYEDRLRAGENPSSFDKDVLRRWLASHGFRGDGPVPVIDPEVRAQMRTAYLLPYTMIVRNHDEIKESTSEEIREAVSSELRSLGV